MLLSVGCLQHYSVPAVTPLTDLRERETPPPQSDGAPSDVTILLLCGPSCKISLHAPMRANSGAHAGGCRSAAAASGAASTACREGPIPAGRMCLDEEDHRCEACPGQMSQRVSGFFVLWIVLLSGLQEGLW